jgi:hypothetical protein
MDNPHAGQKRNKKRLGEHAPTKKETFNCLSNQRGHQAAYRSNNQNFSISSPAAATRSTIKKLAYSSNNTHKRIQGHTTSPANHTP